MSCAAVPRGDPARCGGGLPACALPSAQPRRRARPHLRQTGKSARWREEADGQRSSREAAAAERSAFIGRYRVGLRWALDPQTGEKAQAGDDWRKLDFTKAADTKDGIQTKLISTVTETRVRAELRAGKIRNHRNCPVTTF